MLFGLLGGEGGEGGTVYTTRTYIPINNIKKSRKWFEHEHANIHIRIFKSKFYIAKRIFECVYVLCSHIN